MTVTSEHRIGDLEQWQLLMSVHPLFESDLRWTPLATSESVNIVSKESIRESAALFKIYMKEIPIYVPTDHTLSDLTYPRFLREINALLSSLEHLVGEVILERAPLSEGTGHGLARRYRKLVALSHLISEIGEGTQLDACCQFLCLAQDSVEFKATRYDIEGFNRAMRELLSDPSPVPKTPMEGKSYISNLEIDSIRTASSRLDHLFDALTSHLQECTEHNPTYPTHRAMLQLRHGIFESEKNDDCSEVGLLLASCPLQDKWQHTQVTISGNSQLESFDPDIDSICDCVNWMNETQQILAIELCGDRMTDISASLFGQDIQHPDATPTISLSDLVERGILKDRYRFFPNDKKILAYTLSQALVCLHNGPWLQNLWTLDNIFFMHEPAGDIISNVHHPYISCVLSADGPPIESLDGRHQYPLIFAFAKLLVELDIGEEIHPSMKNGRPDLFFTMLDICKVWSNQQLDVHYAQALDACVKFPKYFREDRQRKPDITITDVILRRIVMPLERGLDLSRHRQWGQQHLDLKHGLFNVLLSGPTCPETISLSQQTDISLLTSNKHWPPCSQSVSGKTNRGQAPTSGTRGKSGVCPQTPDIKAQRTDGPKKITAPITSPRKVDARPTRSSVGPTTVHVPGTSRRATTRRNQTGPTPDPSLDPSSGSKSIHQSRLSPKPNQQRAFLPNRKPSAKPRGNPAELRRRGQEPFAIRQGRDMPRIGTQTSAIGDNSSPSSARRDSYTLSIRQKSLNAHEATGRGVGKRIPELKGKEIQANRRSREDVEVALICALPLEANAILSLFEEHWTRGLARASDQYSYSFGVLGGCNVVLAHPSGMGKVKAANIAAACAVTFTNIKLALVVGVCGAAPHTETKGDIMLGDVIISKGVFQYDFGRRFPDYFQQKSPLKEPNARIGSLLAKAEADFHRSELENKISQTLSDMETAGAQIYPNEDDRLFLSSYRHKHQEHVDCTLCATCVTDEDAVCKDATESGCNEIGCDPTNLVQRSRCNVKNQPAVQFGYVASGDTVVKSGSYRDRIIQECKVIGFEMEGAAVWDVFPAVVIIKGACDYADSHKNKLWQNYAAATAAACAKAFLQLWQDP